MKKLSLLLVCTAVIASLSACGGGGGGSASAPPTQTLAPGAHTLTFAAISTSRLNAPISGIDVAVKLPVGLSVRTDTGGSGQIASTSITRGSAISAPSLVLGNYSASTRTAYLSIVTTQENCRGGEYLNLTFDVAAGTAVTLNDIYALNATYPKYKVVGLDAATRSSVNLTDSIKTILGFVP